MRLQNDLVTLSKKIGRSLAANKHLAVFILFLAITFFLLSWQTVLAKTVLVGCDLPPNSVSCEASGSYGGDGGGGDGDGGGGNPQPAPTQPPACQSGTYTGYLERRPAVWHDPTTPGEPVYDPTTGAPMCELWWVKKDFCSGDIQFEGFTGSRVVCGGAAAPDDDPYIPCVDGPKFIAGGIACEEWPDGKKDWAMRASVAWPRVSLGVYPYPATLVRWPTTIKLTERGSSGATDRIDYIPFGGGDEDNPAVGDWQDVRLSVSIRPFPDGSPAMIFLPVIGEIPLFEGEQRTFSWEVPSHPAAASPELVTELGNIDFFHDELPEDITVFIGSNQSYYMAYYTFAYEEYKRECDNGANGSGVYECATHHGGVLDGHYEYKWKPHSQTIPLLPSLFPEAPASIKKDINGDGVADVWMSNRMEVCRMNEFGALNDPVWGRCWSTGSDLYWAVREAQTVISWPDGD